jgi:hypothetical protein
MENPRTYWNSNNEELHLFLPDMLDKPEELCQVGSVVDSFLILAR